MYYPLFTGIVVETGFLLDRSGKALTEHAQYSHDYKVTEYGIFPEKLGPDP